MCAGENAKEDAAAITEEIVRQIARQEIRAVIWEFGHEVTIAVSCGAINAVLSYYWWKKRRCHTPLQDYVIRRGGGVIGSIIGCTSSRLVVGHMIVRGIFRLAGCVVPQPLLERVPWRPVIILLGGGFVLIVVGGLLGLIGAFIGDRLGAAAAGKLHQVVSVYLNETAEPVPDDAHGARMGGEEYD